MTPFFPESWSLSVEEFAYVLLPMILLGSLFFVSVTHRRTAFLIAVLLMISACYLARFHYDSTTSNTTLMQWNVALKSVVIYRLDSIFTGVAFGWLSLNHTGHWMRFRFLYAVAGFLILAFFSVGIGYFGITIEEHRIFWNVLYLPVLSVGIAMFLPLLSQWKTANRTIAVPVTFISLISYSIYLLHYSIVLQSMKQIVSTELLSPIRLLLFVFSYIGITLVLSYILFRFYEKPMMDLRDKA
jgi:peptidoglycan/LPS O-acetylase OafA/YrhL